MSELGKKFRQHMVLRGFSDKTVESYEHAIVDLLRPIRGESRISCRPYHIESAPDRMMVRVEQGKGRKDRYTLLSHRALAELRAYWLQERPKEWLFPRADDKGPMTSDCASHIYKAACAKAGIPPERARGIHTLRHCFASHLMEDGVALPVIQRLLGHRNLSTTSVYCHVSRAHLENVRSPADRLCGNK